VEVRFQVNDAGDRNRRPDPLLCTVDGRGDVTACIGRPDGNLGRNKQFLRPQVQGL
jgi:hypothetical protein